MWHHRIVESRSWPELLDVAREYIASLSPQEWASVPHKCRPTRIKGIDDLDFWHQRLAEAFLDVAATSKATDMHREMLAFFTAAAERASEMCGSASDEGESAANDVTAGRSGADRRRQDRA